MRTAGIILALLFTTATVSAQATFELTSAPDAAIHAVVLAVPGSPPPPPERTVITPEYWPAPPSRIQPEDPPSSTIPPPSGPSSPPPRPAPKRRAPVVSAHLEVENSGARVIKAVGWEMSLMDKASGADRRRLRFRTETEIQPGQTVVQKYEFPLDPDWQWFASKGRDVRVLVKIERLVYADGAEWRRE